MESMGLYIVLFPPDTAFPACRIYTFVFAVKGGLSLAKTAIGTCFT